MYLCNELKMKNRLHQECYTRSCRETEELKRRCYKEEDGVTQQKLNNYSMQHDQESRTVSLFAGSNAEITRPIGIYGSLKNLPISLLTEQFWQCPSFTSRTYSLDLQKAKPRIQNAANFRKRFDCQHARRVPEELHNDSRNWQHHRGFREEKEVRKGGSEEPLQSLPLRCFSVGAREKGLDDRNCHHAAGIGTCTQSGMINPSYLSSEMHLQKFPDQTEFQSWIVNFQAGVCAKAKNLALALQWIKEIEAASSLKDLINPKSVRSKDVPRL